MYFWCNAWLCYIKGLRRGSPCRSLDLLGRGRLLRLGAHAAEEREALLLARSSLSFNPLSLGTDLLQSGVLVIKDNHGQTREVGLEQLLHLGKVLLSRTVGSRVVVDHQCPVVVVVLILEDTELA